MEIEINPIISPDSPIANQLNESGEITFKKITEYLIKEKNVYLKNQQRDESELSFEEKADIIQNIYKKGAITFLTRFGKYLKSDHLNFFIKFENDSEEVKNLLHTFHKANDKRTKRTRNRRFAALKHMVENDSYFSETEMMKRNPLLYEQLVGRYLTNEEKKQRDLAIGNITLVDILMEGLERDEAESKRKKEEIDEIYCGDTSEEDSSEEERDQKNKTVLEINPKTESSSKIPPQPSCSLWGEYTNQNVSTTSWEEMAKPSASSSFSFNMQKQKKKSLQTSSNQMVTATERKLLRDEFVTTMYENFLEGKDEDFDYSNVDENEEYDNLELISRDEEEKYFDSEEPEDLEMEADENKKLEKNTEDEESSEDELDIYMSALNQHPAVCQLSKDIEKL
ncbi:coiled-coil domain-containing protein 97 [Agrilus planipennis]|uniref:Coiled-coil domain-containing protein 97 n=1 Tax=Agrilus planipennis TaxID=224129 RepID=A0A1W4XJG1_AGRPL|nr:coiled-coil domain-containing protein 97 [Agrilus planipennis]